MSERRTKPRRDEDKLAYYPWYPRDAEADGPVKLMAIDEYGCYRALLDYQWLNGRLPDDTALLTRICKNIPVKRMAKIWETLSKQFPDGLNRRMEREREYVLGKSAQATAAANLRWEKERERRHVGANARADASSPHIPKAMPNDAIPKAKANTETEGGVISPEIGPAQEVWESYVGLVNRVKFGKAVGPVLAKYGADVTLKALKFYVTGGPDKPSFRSPERFAGQAAHCVDMTRPLTADELAREIGRP